MYITPSPKPSHQFYDSYKFSSPDSCVFCLTCPGQSDQLGLELWIAWRQKTYLSTLSIYFIFILVLELCNELLYLWHFIIFNIMLRLPLLYNCSVICVLYLCYLFTLIVLTLDDLYFVLFKSISVDLNGPNIWVVTVGIWALVFP